jgi:pimeloyl-ACP methyl ester carboxylesterase
VIARLLVAILAAAGALQASAAEEVVSVPTRDGATQRYLLVPPAGAKARAIAVSFVGGAGAIDLARRQNPDGGVRLGDGANFLVRVRADLAGDDIAGAIVDSPSDRLPGGMSDAYRASEAHATDVRAVIADLVRRYGDVGVYLIGTSRGTVSVAHLASRLEGALRGVALTSTVTTATRVNPGLAAFDFSSIRVPALFVHHRDDGCVASPYAGAERAARGHALVGVSGGDPARSGPCEPLAPHGFLGREKATVEVLRNWMLGRPFPREIS